MRSALLGVAVGVWITVLAFVVGIGARMVFGESCSVAAVSACVAGFGLVVVAWRWSHLAAGAALAVLFDFIPVALFGTAWALSVPLAYGHTMRCGTGDIGLPFLAALMIFAGNIFAIPLAMLSKVERISPIVWPIAAVAVTACAAIVAALGVKSLARPEPDRFHALFTEHARLEPGATVSLGASTFTYDATVKPAPLQGDRSCTIHVFEDGIPRTNEGVYAPDVCVPLEMEYDPTSKLVLVRRTDEAQATAAIFGTASYGSDVVVSDFRGRLGVPRAWVFGSGGVLLGFFALLRAFAALRRRSRLSATREAAHVGAGWVKLDAHTAPRHVPELAAHSPGAVVVLDARTNNKSVENATYRDDGSPAELHVTASSREALRAGEYARAIAWSCVAIAASSAACAPLWAARLHGLL